jgi:hypothetical protein
LAIALDRNRFSLLAHPRYYKGFFPHSESGVAETVDDFFNLCKLATNGPQRR